MAHSRKSILRAAHPRAVGFGIGGENFSWSTSAGARCERAKRIENCLCYVKDLFAWDKRRDEGASKRTAVW